MPHRDRSTTSCDGTFVPCAGGPAAGAVQRRARRFPLQRVPYPARCRHSRFVLLPLSALVRIRAYGKRYARRRRSESSGSRQRAHSNAIKETGLLAARCGHLQQRPPTPHAPTGWASPWHYRRRPSNAKTTLTLRAAAPLLAYDRHAAGCAARKAGDTRCPGLYPEDHVRTRTAALGAGAAIAVTRGLQAAFARLTGLRGLDLTTACARHGGATANRKGAALPSSISAQPVRAIPRHGKAPSPPTVFACASPMASALRLRQAAAWRDQAAPWPSLTARACSSICISASRVNILRGQAEQLTPASCASR